MQEFEQVEIWIIEDDAGSNFVYKSCLSSDYSLKFYPDLKEFLTAIKNEYIRPNLIIADLILPDGNFVNILEDGVIKNLPPVIVVSGLGDVEILRTCFKFGVNDYLVKPFKKAELITKVEKTIRNSKVFNDINPDTDIDPVLLEFNVNSDLTPKERKILYLFLKQDNFILSREKIRNSLWGNTNVTPKTLDVHLHNLRKKIRKDGHFIETLPNGSWKLSTNGVDS